MAKQPNPWYWEARAGWYVTVSAQRHPLGAHPEGAAPPQKSKKTNRWNPPQAVLDAFHRLMRGEAPQAPPAGSETVVALLDDFISWAKENRAALTASRYEEFCQSFVKATVDGVKIGTLAASRLTARHASEWLKAQEGWGPTTKRNALTALMRGFNWAVKNRGLDKNPLKGMDKPEAKRRTQALTPDEFEGILPHCAPEFRDLLVVTYDTGARPFEVKRLEARHVQPDKQRIVLPATEAKGRKEPRAFYYATDRAKEVIERLSRLHPEGALFRNGKGNRWTGDAVKCAFARLEEKVGRRISQYMLRHSRITDWLLGGVDSHTVAKLAGHKDTKMLDSTYSHVQDDYAYMLEQAKKRAK